MKKIGTWIKEKGSIIVKIPKWRIPDFRTKSRKPILYKCKYIGSPDEPFNTADVEKDMLSEHKTHVKLITTSTRGGDVMELV